MSQRITVVLALLSFLGTSAAAEPPADTANAKKVDVTVTDWGGVAKIVERHRGRIVVVDVWTTTCETCVTEFPGFVRLRERFGEKVALVGVNCDYDGIATKPPAYYRPKVVAFLEEQGATFDNVLLNVPFVDFLEAVDLGTTPAVYVYGTDGKLLKRFDNDDAVRIEDEFDVGDVAAFVASQVK
jgi:thiol-disulfide isomerase/thioredoxin